MWWHVSKEGNVLSFRLPAFFNAEFQTIPIRISEKCFIDFYHFSDGLRRRSSFDDSFCMRCAIGICPMIDDPIQHTVQLFENRLRYYSLPIRVFTSSSYLKDLKSFGGNMCSFDYRLLNTQRNLLLTCFHERIIGDPVTSYLL